MPAAFTHLLADFAGVPAAQLTDRTLVGGLIVAAAGAFAPAILTSMLITAISFLPVLAFSGETGRLLRPLALTKTLVLGAAALVTLTLAPVLRGGPAAHGPAHERERLRAVGDESHPFSLTTAAPHPGPAAAPVPVPRVEAMT